MKLLQTFFLLMSLSSLLWANDVFVLSAGKTVQRDLTTPEGTGLVITIKGTAGNISVVPTNNDRPFIEFTSPTPADVTMENTDGELVFGFQYRERGTIFNTFEGQEISSLEAFALSVKEPERGIIIARGPIYNPSNGEILEGGVTITLHIPSSMLKTQFTNTTRKFIDTETLIITNKILTFAPKSKPVASAGSRHNIQVQVGKVSGHGNRIAGFLETQTNYFSHSQSKAAAAIGSIKNSNVGHIGDAYMNFAQAGGSSTSASTSSSSTDDSDNDNDMNSNGQYIVGHIGNSYTNHGVGRQNTAAASASAASSSTGRAFIGSTPNHLIPSNKPTTEKTLDMEEKFALDDVTISNGGRNIKTPIGSCTTQDLQMTVCQYDIKGSINRLIIVQRTQTGADVKVWDTNLGSTNSNGQNAAAMQAAAAAMAHIQHFYRR